MTGYIYINLLLVTLIALGFVLSGGFILSKKNYSNTKSTELYKLVDKGAVPSNPTLQLSTLGFIPCSLGGLDIALVIDRSASIIDSELDQIKDALDSFVTSLSGGSNQFSLTTFHTLATNNIDHFTSDSNETIRNIYSINITRGDDRQGNGATNWQDALNKTKDILSSSSNRSSNPDLVVFVSDGNPTMIGTKQEVDSDGNLLNYLGEARSEEAFLPALTVAETIKKDYGATILALGIGDSLNIDNLEKISGTISGPVLPRYVISTDFDTLAADLAIFTENSCTRP